MEFLDKALAAYVESHTSAEPEVLRKLNRETHAKVLMPRMLSGHFQGRILSLISKLLNPEYILEIGTYTGYSAICLAEGLREEGLIYTIDKNEELESIVLRHFKESGNEKRIKWLVGNALDIIPTLDITFDMVFIDADKVNYLNYYHLVIDKVRTGGLIIADNVLWSGKVVESGKTDKDTQAIMEFNDFVHQDDKVENVLLPIRDGLMILRKK